MATNALYYPWIDPPNRSLLATAILYWDRLFTIVPEGVKVPYENQWSKSASDLGFLRPRIVDAACEQVQKASVEFAADLDRGAIRADLRYEQARLGKRRKRGYRLHRSKMGHSLHPEKLSHKLRMMLFQSQQPDEDGFYRVSEGYASAYMTRLASVISEDDQLAPYTNRRLSRDVLVDRYVNEHEDIVGTTEVALSTLSIGTIRIAPGTSLTELVQFRDDHYDELKRYRKTIRTLARQVSAIASPEFQEREIKRIVKEDLMPAQEVIGAKLREAGCDFTISALQVTSAAAVGYAASGGAKGYLGAIAGAAVGLGWQIVRWRMAKQRLKKDPLAYLANLRSRFHEEDVST